MPRIRLTPIELDLKVRAGARAKLVNAGLAPDDPLFLAAEAYLDGIAAVTASNAAGSIRDWITYCRGRRFDVQTATNDQAQAYARVLRSAYVPTSVYGKCASIRSFYATCIKRALRSDNPFTGVASGTADPVHPTPALDQEQLAAFIQGLVRDATAPGASLVAKRDAALVYTLMRIGPRRIEAHRMTWKCFGRDRGVPVLRVHGKGDRFATMSLPDDVEAMLAWWRDELAAALGRDTRGHDAIFPAIGTGNWELRQAVERSLPLPPVGAGHLTSTFKRLLAEAGLGGPRMAAHVARATAATIGYEATKDIVAVQGMLRHASVETTYRYIRRRGDARSVAGTWGIPVALPRRLADEVTD
jgi:site-specific recombinase XerD